MKFVLALYMVDSPLVTPFAGVWIEILFHLLHPCQISVTPFAGVWIEIHSTSLLRVHLFVTPFAGVWIEIRIIIAYYFCEKSLPSRECGLKFGKSEKPLMRYKVTPFAGVWIEMPSKSNSNALCTSLPSRECGLKFLFTNTLLLQPRHSLRGSVD